MNGPEKGVPAETFTLRNTSGKDVRFKGWLLAEVSNHNPEAVDENRVVSGSKRWKERAVYQTEAGRIVCHKVGRSVVPGEVDRGEVLVVKTDADLQRDFFAIAEGIGGLQAPDGGTAPLKAKPVEQQVIDFFNGDALAKDLLAELGIEDVAMVDDAPSSAQPEAQGGAPRKSYIVDKDRLPELYPTQRHSSAFWTSLGRAVATFGFLEEVLAKAIFALTGTREAPTDAAALKVVLEAWGTKLEKSISDTLSPLIDTFGKAASEHPESRHQNLGDLLRALREAAQLRNVICHGSWRPPNANGASVPFYVNRQRQVFETHVDCQWLDQLRGHTAELCVEVINAVTHMGYQFPGSNGPGRPIT